LIFHQRQIVQTNPALELPVAQNEVLDSREQTAAHQIHLESVLRVHEEVRSKEI
jgi:hypothetical protein